MIKNKVNSPVFVYNDCQVYLNNCNLIDLISKFQVGLKSLLRQGLSEPDFYGDLVYKWKKIVGSNKFSAQLFKIISHHKKTGYNVNVLQQTACLVSTQSRLATLLSSLIARRWVELQIL